DSVSLSLQIAPSDGAVLPLQLWNSTVWISGLRLSTEILCDLVVLGAVFEKFSSTTDASSAVPECESREVFVKLDHGVVVEQFGKEDWLLALLAVFTL